MCDHIFGLGADNKLYCHICLTPFEEKRMPGELNYAELQTLLVSAFRYALGRRSYIVSSMADILLNHRDLLSDNSIFTIKRDIKTALETDNYGMELDKKIWLDVLEKLSINKMPPNCS